MHVVQDSSRTGGEAYRALLEASKSASGREMLLTCGKLEEAAAEATGLLSAWSPESDEVQQQQLLLLLRLLRNSCALGAAAAAILLRHKLQEGAAKVAARLATGSINHQERCEPHGVSSSTPHSAHVSSWQQSQQQQQQRPCEAVSALQQQQQQVKHHQQYLSSLLLAAVQLLSNLSATGPQGAAAVWAALFPAHLCSILQANDVCVHEAVALTALSCARNSSSAQQDLISAAAHTAWQQLLEPLTPQPDDTQAQHNSSSSSSESEQLAGDPPASSQNGVSALAMGVNSPTAAAVQALPTGNDNLCLLIKFLAMQQNHLQQLMELLCLPAMRAANGTAVQVAAATADAGPSSSVPPGGSAAAFTATEQHALLLHVVAVEAAAVPAACSLPGVPVDVPGCDAGDLVAGPTTATTHHHPPTWLCYVVNLLRDVWAQALAAAAPTAGICSKSTATAHVLEALLQVLKAALARDEDTASGGGASQASRAAAAAGLAAVAQYLHRNGLLQQLLQMLRALGPPPKPKHQQQRELEQQEQQQDKQQQRTTPEPQHEQPYSGYRSDVVAVLSNMLLGGAAVQDAVMAAGGIELLLNNTNLDESSPLAREWGLWGIRNACKDNEAVQSYVAQFKAVDAVQSAELDRMGMQLELDQMTHKLRLAKKPGTQ